VKVAAVHAEQKSTKLVGAIGVVGFIVPAVSSVLFAPTWDFPDTDATANTITGYVVEHRDALLAGVTLNSIAVTLWGLFGVGIWLRLRRASGGESYASACFLFGVISFVTLLLAGFTCFLVLAYRAQEVSDARLLYDVAFAMLAMSGIPTAVALGSYAWLTLRTGHLPAWTAVLAAVGAAAHVILLASFVVTGGFFSLEGQVISVVPATLFFWILGTGIAMLRDSSTGGRIAPST
jgi:hypothetical protein